MNVWAEPVEKAFNYLKLALICLLLAGVTFGAGLLIGLTGAGTGATGSADTELKRYKELVTSGEQRERELEATIEHLTSGNEILADNYRRAVDQLADYKERLEQLTASHQRAIDTIDSAFQALGRGEDIQASMDTKLQSVIDALQEFRRWIKDSGNT